MWQSLLPPVRYKNGGATVESRPNRGWRKVGIMVLLAGVLLLGYGGKGCPWSKDKDDVVTGSSAPAAPSLNLTALDLGKVVSLTKNFPGDTGSSMEGYKVKVDKLELTTDAGATWVTVYSGNEYLETVGTGTDSVAGALTGTMPSPGIYTGCKLTISNSKVKVKIVSGATTYYTTAQTVESVSPGTLESTTPWPLSTSSADYDYITISSTGDSTITDFPTPLTITGNSDVNIVWACERCGIVTYNGTLPDNVISSNEEDIVHGILPAMPSKQIKLALTAPADPAHMPPYPALSNTITLLLDDSGNLLGGYCYSPSDRALDAADLKGGSLSNVSNGGNTAAFDVSFWGWPEPAYFRFTGNYDCGTSTSGTYSGLAVTGWDGATTEYGCTLDQTGSVTSK